MMAYDEISRALPGGRVLFFSTKTIERVVIHHADGLHVGIHNRWTEKFETALFQIFGPGIGFRDRDGIIFHCLDFVLDWFFVHPRPHVS